MIFIDGLEPGYMIRRLFSLRMLQFGKEDANGSISFRTEHNLVVFKSFGYSGEIVQGQQNKMHMCNEWKFLLHVFQHCLSKRKAGWNNIASNTSSALVGLVNREPFNMGKYIFDGMLDNIAQTIGNKILMYPRFVQLLIDEALPNILWDEALLELSHHEHTVFSLLTKRYDPPKYAGSNFPLFACMIDPEAPPPVAPGLS
jgi:hypothetical protein